MQIILFKLINNTINWNNTISNLWEKSNEKVLQLTEQHAVKKYEKSRDA